MKRVISFLLLLLVLSYPTFGQGFDFEVGYELSLEQANSAYLSARYNWALGDELFGVQTWILPEGGVWLRDPLTGYLRVQILLDTQHLTAFGDCRTDLQSGYCRVGARFGIP